MSWRKDHVSDSLDAKTSLPRSDVVERARVVCVGCVRGVRAFGGRYRDFLLQPASLFFRGAVRFTHLEGAGTLVAADPDLEPAQFGTVIKAAIARAQQVPGDDPASPR